MQLKPPDPNDPTNEPSRGRYPWDIWQNGAPHIIHRAAPGTYVQLDPNTFPGSVSNMLAVLHVHKRQTFYRNRLHFAAKSNAARQEIIFQFYPDGEPTPILPPFPSIPAAAYTDPSIPRCKHPDCTAPLTTPPSQLAGECVAWSHELKFLAFTHSPETKFSYLDYPQDDPEKD